MESKTSYVKNNLKIQIYKRPNNGIKLNLEISEAFFPIKLTKQIKILHHIIPESIAYTDIPISIPFFFSPIAFPNCQSSAHLFLH